MSVIEESTAAKSAGDATQCKPTTAQTRIHWADTGEASEATRKADRQQALEQKFEAMRARNWITDRMVAQYQKHWSCSREAALERLLSKTSA